MTTPPLPGCDGARITAYVDGALAPEERGVVESHLAGCASCRDQEAFERGLRERLRALPAPEVPAGLEGRIGKRIRHRPRPAAVRWLPVAAGIVLALLWARGAAPFVSWEVARDHRHCFGREHLPAEVWSSDARQIGVWYREHGTELPLVPSAVGGIELVGGRYCPLLDRKVAHLYYAGEKQRLSVFVVPGPARFASGYAATRRGDTVRLLRTSGVTLAIVGDDPATVEAFHRALSVSRADAGGGVRWLTLEGAL
jgi:anti-sigma factor RsiW